MQSPASAVPEGYQAIMPYLSIKDAARAIEFYKTAFNAVERLRMDAPGGLVGHAELVIGDAALMLADEFPGHTTVQSPKTIGGTTVSIHLYVADADAFVAQALQAGATLIRPVEDQFYGDRSGQIADPFGHVWHVATRKEQVTPEEMMKRAQALAQ